MVQQVGHKKRLAQILETAFGKNVVNVALPCSLSKQYLEGSYTGNSCIYHRKLCGVHGKFYFALYQCHRAKDLLPGTKGAFTQPGSVEIGNQLFATLTGRQMIICCGALIGLSTRLTAEEPPALPCSVPSRWSVILVVMDVYLLLYLV